MRPAPIRFFALFWILLGVGFKSGAQCPDMSVNQALYGTDSWKGYVYNGVNTFDPLAFIGLKDQTTTVFDEQFGTLTTDPPASCPLTPEAFSVRFKNRQDFPCGLYTFNIGSDYGVRFSIDGGTTFLVNIPSGTGYTVTPVTVHLSGGTYDLVLDYFHETGPQRVSFDYVFTAGNFGGVVSGDQTICANPADPAPLTSQSVARFCSELPAGYQWEVNIDGNGYNQIPGATMVTYDPPAGLAAGSYLYRRRATSSASELIYSNEISVVIDIPQGDETAFGTDEWNAYAYEGADNFSSGYLGSFTEAVNFNNNLDAVVVDGCDLPVENFSIRYKMERNIVTCDGYDITIGAEGGGARLYVDGTLVIDGYAPVTSLATYSINLFLDPGSHEFILEYYNNAGANSVSFNMTASGNTGGGGVIGADQVACGATYDPIAFTSIEPAEFCGGGAVTYEWQRSDDGTFPGIVVGGNSPTFDEGSLPPGTYYYRRSATDGSVTVQSNIIVVQVQEPEGDENTYASEAWYGYAYQGSTIATGTYLGYFDIATATFDFDFTCEACDMPINGCDLYTEDFSTRLKSTQDIDDCGGYDVTIGAQGGGVRLYVNGDLVIDGSGTNETYTEYTRNIYLDGLTNFDIEYFNVSGPNRVSFNYTLVSPDGSGGIISGNQNLCMPTLDPAPFTSITEAQFCSGPPTSYRWEVLEDGDWVPAVPAGNAATYDIPSGLAPGEYTYRRVAIFGAVELPSNELEVLAYSPNGDEVSFGENQWIGYVYDNQEDWENDYRGQIIRPTNFDESFCAGLCQFPTDGCPVNGTGFSVLFKNRLDFECGSYLITIGGDDGVELSINGIPEPGLSALTQHPYLTYSKVIYFDQASPDTELELKYFEASGPNRVSFSSVFLGPGWAGEIAGDQYSCDPGLLPDPLTNVEDAVSCAGAPITYQWQYSLDGLGWKDIDTDGDGPTYTPTDPIDVTHYYRRQAIIEGYTLNSNVITIEIDPPQGDEVTYGQNQWIGYVYDALDGPERDPINYVGYMIENTNFDQTFCGSKCIQAINGCNFETESFAIKYFNEMTLECGTYRVTIGFNNGAQLFIDGDQIFSEWWVHGGYETREFEVLLGGTHEFNFNFLDAGNESSAFGRANRVTFNIEYLGPGTPARIGNNQVLCGTDAPNQLREFIAPEFVCDPDPDTPPDYQWQISSDEVNWTDIPGATGTAYTPPAGHTFTRYYRLRNTNDMGEELYSNVVTVVYDDELPPHDGSEYGMAPQWIAHVYDGPDNYVMNYHGSFIQEMTDNAFGQSFCGENCVFPIDGCDIVTNTFSVQFKTQIDLAPGEYTFTLASIGAVRLTISGGEFVSPVDVVSDGYHGWPVREVSNGSPLELQGGTYYLDLYFYDNFDQNIVSFSYIYTPLPVTWHSFSGYFADGQSFLKWQTASEINNEGFDVEHSVDGANFTRIGWVDGNGSTNVAQEYQFVHNNPAPGWNYYRLRQVDYDGQYEYSRFIPVFADDLPSVEIHPNPLTNQWLYLSRINTDQAVEVSVTNMMGQDPFVLIQDPMLPTCFHLPRRLAPGLYHVRIRMGEAVYTRKLVIE